MDVDGEPSSRTPFCWGENVDGQLGDGSRSPPEGHRLGAIVELGSASAGKVPQALEVGMGASCVLFESSAPLCWGRNDSAQLGVGGGGPRDAERRPVPLELSKASLLTLGARHTCARVEEGRVACLGLNHRGQLGDGTRTLRREPVMLEALEDVVDLGAGVGHTCALRADGQVLCWGDNRQDQLGTGVAPFSFTPLPVGFAASTEPAVAAGAD